MAQLYEEIITFHPLVSGAYLLAIATWAWRRAQPAVEGDWVLWPIGLLLVALPLLFGRLKIRVDEKSVTATFGFVGWPVQKVPMGEIVRARAVSYRPLLQFGGWGMRIGRFEGARTSVYSLRGDRGVLLELSEPRRVCAFHTERFLLGSQEPERLAVAIGKE
jgi:hypothetical protein